MLRVEWTFDFKCGILINSVLVEFYSFKFCFMLRLVLKLTSKDRLRLGKGWIASSLTLPSSRWMRNARLRVSGWLHRHTHTHTHTQTDKDTDSMGRETRNKDRTVGMNSSSNNTQWKDLRIWVEWITVAYCVDHSHFDKCYLWESFEHIPNSWTWNANSWKLRRSHSDLSQLESSSYILAFSKIEYTYTWWSIGK